MSLSRTDILARISELMKKVTEAEEYGGNIDLEILDEFFNEITENTKRPEVRVEDDLGVDGEKILRCPTCYGTDNFRFVEDIQNWRKVYGIEDGTEGQTLMLSGLYQSGEGYDDGTDGHLECHNYDANGSTSLCLEELEIPENLKLDFV